MKKYILALDEGTTSARSILFDKSLSVVSMAQHEFTQFYPKPGWVEHDPMQIYASQYASLTECIAKSGISADEIAGIKRIFRLYKKDNRSPYRRLFQRHKAEMDP